VEDSKNRLPKPNYTQVPNVVLEDWLPEMKGAELKVVLAICRKTFGWHKVKDRISLTQLQKATGLSRQGVINGLNDAIDRGIVEKTGNAKTGYSYELLVNEVDHLADHNDLTGQYSRPVLVNEVDQASQRSRPALVNEVDTQKKLKETKERKNKEIKDDNLPVDAGASSLLNGSTPVTLEGWMEHIESEANPVTGLGNMAVTILGLDQQDKKLFGRVGQIYKKDFGGDWRFMASKIWALPASNPVGDKLNYLSKSKSSNGYGQQQTDAQRTPAQIEQLENAKRQLEELKNS
jgi:phage replication O-like protein O